MPVQFAYGKGKSGSLTDHKDRQKRRGLRKSGSSNPAQITPDAIRALGAAMCTLDEMSSYFGVKRSWFDAKVRRDPELLQAYKEGRGRAMVTLRRRQVEQANNGNVQMLIWLGKNYLKQSDKQTLSLTDEMLDEDDTEAVMVRWTEDLDNDLAALDAEVNGG